MSDQYLSTEQARQLAIHWAKAEPIVRVYIAAAIGQGHPTDDILQEVAAIVTEKFNTYDSGQPFTNWALGIARNRIAKSIRSKVRDRHVFSSELISDLADIVAEIQPELETRKSALRDCMARLKGRTLRIVEMRYQWGRQVQQIADELGMTRVAVSGVLMRGRRSLAQCIEQRIKQEESSA